METDKKTRSYYDVRPSLDKDEAKTPNDIIEADNDNTIEQLNLNDGKNRYVLVLPDVSSTDFENQLREKYPKSSFSRMNNHEFKMTSANGKEVAVVHSNTQGKHIILLERPSNRVKIKQEVMESYDNYSRNPRWKSSSLNYNRAHKEREDDEILRKPVATYNTFEGPKKDHFAIVKSTTQLDTPIHGGTKIGDHTYAIPITKDDHDKINALSSYGKSYDEGEVISNEDFRSREKPKYAQEFMNRVLPGVEVESLTARKTAFEEPKDHYALLHVPAGAEKDIIHLNGVKKSPKGRYYTMVTKSVHESDLQAKHNLVGDQIGYHSLNNENNPRRFEWAPNSRMDHAITVEKTLSPDDVKKMKSQ